MRLKFFISTIVEVGILTCVSLALGLTLIAAIEQLTGL